jgi:hypothetical protein
VDSAYYGTETAGIFVNELFLNEEDERRKIPVFHSSKDAKQLDFLSNEFATTNVQAE